jgi:hypothetical protein
MKDKRRPITPPNKAARRTAETVVRSFYKQQTDPDSIKHNVRRWLIGAMWAVVLIPLLFYLRFGTVDSFGWSFTIFLVAYCLVAAIGTYFLVRPEYHTPVAFVNDWLDRIGAFWLLACTFGPFFGWVLTSVATLTASNWRWFYGGRIGLCIALPVLTALPLLRYVRGRGAPVMLALLLGITALPVWSAWATLQDLRFGPIMRATMKASTRGQQAAELYLPHTERVLARQ